MGYIVKFLVSFVFYIKHLMSKKIDVMIVGAQKDGTTSLLRYMGEHPDCIAHPQKEFAYFIDE